jgi:ribonuclease P protein component
VFTKNTRGYTRVAVVVSKKVEKTAVKRNRIRRRVYEALRVNFDMVPKKHDYVFVVYSKDIGKMEFGELEELLGELVVEAKVCYNE